MEYKVKEIKVLGWIFPEEAYETTIIMHPTAHDNVFNGETIYTPPTKEAPEFKKVKVEFIDDVLIITRIE